MIKKALILFLLFIPVSCYAADLTLQWDAATGVTGYKIYQSTDTGTSWDAGVDVGNVTSYVYPNVPETGLVLFRVSAYNATDEAVRYEAGAWYNFLWYQPPPSSVSFTSIGITGVTLQ